MSKRQSLRHSIASILKNDGSGSFATKACRKNMLMKFADDIFKVNIQLTNIWHLKEKHIDKVVDRWKSQGLTIGTIKNRMASVRHLCRLMNKEKIVKTNAELKIDRRNYKPTFNRAIFNPDFSRITDVNIKVSLELQRVFGLRRAECMKIKPHLADRKNFLVLSPSWCKGGRARIIPIRNEEQRYWLNMAKQLAGNVRSSLIPSHKSYKTHAALYDKQVQRAEIRNPHGLRHAYAQIRYKELTGWEAPINGGPTRKELTPEQKLIDHEARLIITEELGHSRKQIVSSYCGK